MTTQTVAIAAGTYQLDPSHSEIGFRVKHLGLSTVKGAFKGFEGTITADSDGLSGLTVSAKIEVSTIDTRNDDRDNHLRSADFFDVESHPQLTFESTGVRSIDGDEFALEGNLSIRGVTRPVVLEVTFLGSATDPWGNSKIAFEASGMINRKDFGLTWNQVLEAGGLLVGEEVKIMLDVQAAKR